MTASTRLGRRSIRGLGGAVLCTAALVLLVDAATGEEPGVMAGQAGEPTCERDFLLSFFVPGGGDDPEGAPGFGGVVGTVGGVSPEVADRLAEVLGCGAPAPAPEAPGAPATTTTAPPVADAPVDSSATSPAPVPTGGGRPAGPVAAAPTIPAPTAAAAPVGVGGGAPLASPGVVTEPDSGRPGPLIAGLAAMVSGALWVGARRGTPTA